MTISAHSLAFLILSFLLFKFSRQFTEETIKFAVSEDAPIHTVIGRITAEDGFTYRLSRGNSKIHFDDQTLEFSVSSLLDRESENAIDMLIITSPPSIIHVLIDIQDVNDNPPKFPSSVQKVEIPETAPPGWRVSIAGATDPDGGKNGTIGGYQLSEDVTASPLPFRIMEEADGFVFLEVTGKLDRETRDLYSMRLTVKDQGDPQLSSSCLLNVFILDTNDNPPDFGIRSIRVDWNGQPSESIFTLNATDADAGANSLLSYRILPPANDFFRIEDITLVTQNNTLDGCSPRCEFVVEARDSGVPPLTTTLSVEVRVEFGNEHEPNVNIRFYPSDFPFIVVQPEDVNGKTLAILSITDPDGPLGDNSSIWISSGNSDNVFSLISRQSINILTLKNVGNARKELYELQFAASDDQAPIPKIGRKSLQIFFKKHVKPTFIHVAPEFHVEIEKDTVPGSFVTHVVTNCTEFCKFELTSDIFRIDTTNGIIVTSSELPDDVTSYHLPVRIRLPPPSTKTLETDVFVKISNIPKNLIRSESTVNLKRTYSFAVWQNVTVGTVVGRLPRGQVYSTTDKESELGVFPDGAIFVGKQIVGDFATLPVLLEDRNTSQKSLITLVIKRTNEHTPSCENQKFHVAEDVPVRSHIGKLYSEDKDSGANGVVSFRLIGTSEYIHVDSDGTLRSLKKWNAEKQRSLTLSYEVMDYGFRRKRQNCTATVFIDDINNNSPKFSSSYYSAKISGSSNVTVSILHATDKDINEENRRISYRLRNYQNYFHVDSESGKVTTIRSIPKTWKRLNLTVEAVNSDSSNALKTESFILIDVVSSDDVLMQVKSKSVVKVYRSDEPGTKTTKFEVESSESLTWKIEDPRFFMQENGDIILNRFANGISVESFDVIVTFSNGSSKNFEHRVEFVNSERAHNDLGIIELAVHTNQTRILKLEDDRFWKISRIITETSESDFDESPQFFLENKTLFASPVPESFQKTYVFLEAPESQLKVVHLTHLTASHSSSFESHCTSSVHLISPPATISLSCEDVSLQNNISFLQIHEDSLLIPAQNELISHVDLISKSSMKPFMVTLIKDEPTEEVKFASNNVLMLLSSVHNIGASFGRVTAESSYRIRYYLVGTNQVSIDADTGELFLKERFYRNLNDIQIIAVIPTGIAKAKVTIEVIEDRLQLSTSNFVVFAPSLFSKGFKSEETPLGKLAVGRDDVIVDIVDDNFYSRQLEVFAKKHFVPTSMFYDLEGVVKKGKLSTGINLTIFFSTGGREDIKENELMFEVEENSPAGTVVGVVPNYKTSKYRLIDPKCGLLIDQDGVIRTTTSFDREDFSLLKTKMIEPTENRIWDILVFIGDVNDNAPKISNAPGKIILNENELIYQLDWQDPDDIASDVRFFIVDGDPYGHLNVTDSGQLILKSMPSESFNATFRIIDNIPPFPVNFDDVTIEFVVPKTTKTPQCEDSTFWIIGQQPKKYDVIGILEGSQLVTWRILPETLPYAEFTIDPLTGDVRMDSDRLLKNGDLFDIGIQVMSFDGTSSGFCHLKVHVDEISSSEKMIFDKNSIEFSVSESADRGMEIGRVRLEEADNVVFRIQDDFNFTVSPFDGTLFCNSPLDFEDIKIYEIVVIAEKPNSELVSANITIHVTDENDEAPRFITGDVVNIWVSEDQKAFPLVIGSSIAEDLDEDGVVTYSILSGNTSLFAVNSTSGDIVLLASLDREASSIHELIIEAKDSGVPSLSATSRILIHVEDVNDNSPEFEQNAYFVRIPENLPFGSKILKVHAEDRDLNPELVYSMESDVFRIDAITGWITVAGRIDREEKESFEITVAVKDSKHSDHCQVKIAIDDVNDNAPIIENQNLDIFVPSDVSEGALLHVIDVHDEDKNSQLSFHLNGTDSEFFKVTKDGEIILAKEGLTTKSYFSVEVTVSDSEYFTSSEYTFYLHPYQEFPVWREKLLLVKVKEHETQELAVFKAKGQGVRYSIVSKCEDFAIESISGILSVKDSLDREKHDECPVFVIATKYVDNKPLSVITKILVEVVDVNDNSPTFQQQVYHFNISENTGPSIVGRIHAEDLDTGSNSRLHYAIVSGDPNHEFQITGEQLEVIRDLDRETQSVYHLTVEAIDDGRPRRRGNTTVIVKVLDEDDNAPRFSRIFHVEIPEDAKIGDFVIQLSASDADETANHRFALEGDDLPFRVEEQTGKVFVSRQLDFEKKPSYRIKVRLADGVWLIETSLFINLKDINDNPPVFQKNEYFFIAENTTSFVGKVIATDLDSGENCRIRYSVNSPFFRINASSGEIHKLRPLPKMLTAVEVTASDHGVPRMQMTVVCHVADENQFEEKEVEKMRKSARIGDIVGSGMKKNALVVPRGIAEIKSNGELILKKTKNEFWIIDGSKITSYVTVPDETTPDEKATEVNLTISSQNEDFIQLDISGCTQFIKQNLSEFKLDSNGVLKMSRIQNITINLLCNDGVWPLRNRDVKVQVIATSGNYDDLEVISKRKPRVKSSRLPNSFDLKVPSEVQLETVLWRNSKRIPFFMEKYSVLLKKQGDLLLKSSDIKTEHLEIFDTGFRRSSVSVQRESDSTADSKACPFFSNEHYFIEKSFGNLTSGILDFGWVLPNHCKVRIDGNNKKFFAMNTSSLISLRRLPPGTYQLHLKMTSDNLISECHVTITMHHESAGESPRLPNIPSAIFIRDNLTTSPAHPVFKLPTGYTLFQNSDFELTDSKELWSRQRLRAGGRSVYRVPVISQNTMNSKNDKRLQEVIRILLDDVIEEPDSNTLEYNVIRNPSSIHNIKLAESLCSPRIGDVFEITSDCHVITPNTYSNISIPVEISNATWHVNIVNSQMEQVEKLDKNAVELEFYGKELAIGRLITDLRRVYSDMKIQILSAYPITPDLHYRASFVIIDRNDVIVAASEAQRTLSSFMEKHRPNYLDFVGFRVNQCAEVTCLEGTMCQTTSEMTSKRLILKRTAGGTIFDLPEGKLIGMCVCTGKECILNQQMKDDVIVQKTEEKSCDEKHCGSGKCVMEGHHPVCRCFEGFESLYECSKASDVFRLNSSGFMDISVKNETVLECDDGCKGIQQIEMDFRTLETGSELIKVQFGRQTAIVEIIDGTVSFSLSDQFTRPIQTKISNAVSDGNWHRLLFQMSENGKKISIQLDGRGKEVKSRIPLPMLFTSDKIRILMSSSICFRRVLIQNQFTHPVLNENRLFHVASSTSSVSSSCEFNMNSADSAKMFNDTTTIILVSVLAIISLIAISVCLLAIWRRKTTSSGEKTDRSGWKKATEIDAFAVPRGHYNRSMVKSPDDDTYENGYATQLKSTNSSSYQQRYRNDGHINMAYL